jgi:hypothetical protein
LCLNDGRDDGVFCANFIRHPVPAEKVADDGQKNLKLIELRLQVARLFPPTWIKRVEQDVVPTFEDAKVDVRCLRTSQSA